MKAMLMTIIVCTVLATDRANAAKAIYFYKPGVVHEAFVAEVAECDQLAGGVAMPRYATYTPNMAAAAASAFFAGLYGSREKRSIVDNVMRTCMTDKKYKRVEALPNVAKQLRRLKGDERVDRLFALSSSPSPAGTVLPQ